MQITSTAPVPVTAPQAPASLVSANDAANAGSHDQVHIGAVASDVATDAFRSLQALPGFLYPSVTGTAAEKALVFSTLDRLPMSDVSTIPSIRMMNNLNFLNKGGDGTILGATFGTGDMLLSRTDGVNAHMSDDLARYVIIHETGHAHDFGGKSVLESLLLRKSNGGPWGKGPFPTQYAESARAEDFAEGHAFYHLTPQEIARIQDDVGARTTDFQKFSPEKYKAMAATEQHSLLQQVVEGKAFRDTGRLVGELSSDTVGAAMHTGLGLLGTFTSFAMATDGFTELVGSVHSRDAEQAVRGGLALAAGVALATAGVSPFLGPAALALMGARRGLDTADRLAESTPRAQQGSKTAAAIGGAVGGAIGGVAGPLGGTLAGYAVGGPVGGVIGLVAGSLVGLRGGSALGARAGLALTR